MESPVIRKPPQDLDQAVSDLAPDALWVEFEHHSDHAWTVQILDLDYRMTVWRASLSLDHRWTLSPIGGPWQGRRTLIDW
jgi:hypothetical protein